MKVEMDVIKGKLIEQGVMVEEFGSFCKLTTLCCGGGIRLVVYPANEKQFVLALNLATRWSIPHVILGYGSNVLASSCFYDGMVICAKKFNHFQVKGDSVTAYAGASTVKMGRELAKLGLSGGEFFCCLPSTVGGAVVGNAGCFSQNTGSVVECVWAMENGKVHKFSAADCHFGYRTSLFKQHNMPVIKVKMRFRQSDARKVKLIIENQMAIKRKTQPLGQKSAGSVLCHPRVAVARLLDVAGLKGYSVGGAAVSKKHAGFAINIDKAAPEDIYLLIMHMQKTLWQRFGVFAESEVRMLNFVDMGETEK